MSEAARGRGRPVVPSPFKKKLMPVRLPEWMIEKIDALPVSRAKTIEPLLIKEHNWKEPKK